MILGAKDRAASIGFCEVLVFEGSPPSAAEIDAFTTGDGEAPANLVRHDVYKNRLNKRAVEASAGMLVGQYTPLPSRLKFGTGAPPVGQTDPTPDDEDCWTPDNATVRDADYVGTWLGYFTVYQFSYDETEINDKTFTEALLLDANNRAWAHVRMPSLLKTANQTLQIRWKIKHVGA